MSPNQIPIWDEKTKKFAGSRSTKGIVAPTSSAISRSGTPVAKTYAFAADWHGNAYWAKVIIKNVAEHHGVKTLYQLGDFGLFPDKDGIEYLDEVSVQLNKYGMSLVIVPGNHDDYNQLSKMGTDEDGLLRFDESKYENIRFLPRGHVWEHDGDRFATLGGAGSIDKLLRVEGETWWSGEEITLEDTKKLIDNVKSLGWDKVDFLLTHEAPAGARIESQINGFNRPSWFTVEVEHYCWTQRMLLRDLVDEIKPTINLHGHWHVKSQNLIDGVDTQGNEYKTQVLGLAAEGMKGNSWIPKEGDIEAITSTEITPEE